jgi:hypothetical protein
MISTKSGGTACKDAGDSRIKSLGASVSASADPSGAAILDEDDEDDDSDYNPESGGFISCNGLDSLIERDSPLY